MEKRDNEGLIKINELNSYSRSVNTIIKVIEKTAVRDVISKSDNTRHKVCEALVGDDSASIYLTLWNKAIDEIEPNIVLEIENGYVTVFRGSMRLNMGKYGRYKILKDSPFNKVNTENNLSQRLVNNPRRIRKYRDRY
jgi:replication factor A1